MEKIFQMVKDKSFLFYLIFAKQFFLPPDKDTPKYISIIFFSGNYLPKINTGLPGSSKYYHSN